MWSPRSGFWRLGRAVNHVKESVRGGTRRQGGDWDSAAGFPRTALIIEPTSDFVPRWQMVGWGGIQGGRFASIVRAHKLHKETIASAKSKNKYILKKSWEKSWIGRKNIISKPNQEQAKLNSLISSLQEIFKCRQCFTSGSGNVKKTKADGVKL